MVGLEKSSCASPVNPLLHARDNCPPNQEHNAYRLHGHGQNHRGPPRRRAPHKGELAFRELEAQLVEELNTRTKTIISTGGGLPTNPANLVSLKKHSLIFCLWLSPEKIFERVKDQSHRPLLHDLDPLGKIRTLLAAREKFYKQADVLLNSDLRSAREVAQQVIAQYHAATKVRK